MILEPYYPNRFARQFGFDQEVPSNCLSFMKALRQQRSIMDLAKVYVHLQRTDTGAKFYVPPSYYEGVCSWDYCRWWTRISTPYLSQYVKTCTKLQPIRRSFKGKLSIIIDHLRPLCEFVPRALEISGATSNNYAKEKSSVSSSERGKAKISKSNKKLQRRRIRELQSIYRLPQQVLASKQPLM